ncbi:hypothetical protein TRVL_06808 [Trypanosoma vivax]|nr:hypothetical protein TRVL_06808 [Trypanosoma vivax]
MGSQMENKVRSKQRAFRPIHVLTSLLTIWCRVSLTPQFSRWRKPRKAPEPTHPWNVQERYRLVNSGILHNITWHFQLYKGACYPPIPLPLQMSYILGRIRFSCGTARRPQDTLLFR